MNLLLFPLLSRQLSNFLSPSAVPARPSRGSSASARWVHLGILYTALFAPALAAATSIDAQVHAMIEEYLMEELQQEADHRGWQAPDLSFEAYLPSNARHLAPCLATPNLQPQAGNELLQSRQRFRLNCAGANGWEISVSAQVQIFVPVLHADAVIERGQRISTADLAMQPFNVSKARRGYFTEADDVTGLIAKRRIRPNQLITPSLLDQPLAIKRGQPVKIVASRDGIQASTSGEALSDGQIGEVIRVRNINSDKVIDAKVLEPGVVSSIF